MPISFPIEHVNTAQASIWCELACIGKVAAGLVGTWEGAWKQPEARALPWAPHCWEKEQTQALFCAVKEIRAWKTELRVHSHRSRVSHTDVWPLGFPFLESGQL